MHAPTLRPLALAASLALAGAANAQLVWNQIQPSPAPSARFDHALCEVYGADSLVMFGGTDGVTVFGDTWTWGHQAPPASSPIVWTHRSSVGPAPRTEHAMARADLASGALLFGGRLANGALSGESWLWRPTGWTQILAPLAPSPRANHALAVDEMTIDEVYLFGGRTASGLSNELWRFQNNAWTLISTAHTPSAREDHVLIWNAGQGGLLLSGGRDESGVLADEWLFDGVDWSLSAAVDVAPRAGHAMAFESLWRRRHMSFGGVGGAPSADVAERTVQSVWLPHATSSGPSARTGATMQVSSQLSVAQFLLFGGRDANGVALGDSWILQPSQAASTEFFGNGCGPGPWGPNGPHLAVYGQPLLGSELELSILTAGTAQRVIVIAGPERPAIPFGGCELVVSTTRRIPIQLTTQSSLQFGTGAISIPFDVALAGTTMALQAVEFSSAGRGVSRAVRMHLEE